jgi:hypothetical protein
MKDKQPDPDHGIYSQDGPDERLRLKGALLQRDPNNEDNYLCQFDPTYLKEAYGWHSFPRNGL